MDQPEKVPINFFENLNEIKGRFTKKEPVIFLDYDGTCTPIVATPDLAVLSDDMRDAIQKLSSKYKVAIVSGRATNDVRLKVKIDGLFYAGSHGFEIHYPDGQIKINDEAAKIRPIIDKVYAIILDKVKHIEGHLVEHVKYTITAHYRNVADADVSKVEQAVDVALAQYPQLKKNSGKKVFELKPKLDWHKGKAVEWIYNIFLQENKDILPFYIGDDTTDEDAFRFLKDKGFGILVADPVRKSDGEFVIKDTNEVKKVLEFFIELT